MSNVTSGTVLPIGQLTAADKIVSVSGFSGIDRRVCPGGVPSAAKPVPVESLRNFRVLSGGALKKRCGFRRLATLPSDVRAACSMKLDGQERLFAVTADGVYLYAEDTGFSQIAQLTSSGTLTKFFRDAKGLCLFTNGQIFRVSTTGLRDLSYIPTYLKDFPTDSVSFLPEDIYEGFNLLSRRVRLIYLCGEETNELTLPFTPKSVESVMVGTKDESARAYVRQVGTLTKLKLPSKMSVGERAEVVCTASDKAFGNADHPLASSRDVFLAEIAPDSRRHLLLAAENGGIRWSAPLPEGGTDAVYIPASHFRDPASDGYPINGFCRHRDRILCLSETTTYQLECLTPSPVFSCSNGSVGCGYPSAAKIVDNTPYTLSDGNLYAFTETDNEIEPYRADLLSDAVGNLAFSGGAILFYDRAGRELWIRDPSDEEGSVHVFCTKSGAWYDFGGIPAKGFFSFRNKVGYFAGGCVFLSDDGLTHDENAQGTSVPIRASLLTHWIGFEVGNPVRRSGAVFVTCKTDGTALTVLAKTDADATAEAVLVGKGARDSGTLSQIECGISPGRFRFLKLGIASDGDGSVGIYRIGVLSRK